MKRGKFTLLVYFIIVLAVIGVISQLFTSPGAFLKGILITLGSAVVLFGVFYYVFIKKKGPSSNEMKKYKQAVKQSHAKYKENKDAFIQKTETGKRPVRQTGQPKNQPKKKARKRAHLRVIDGYKDKGKDRANY